MIVLRRMLPSSSETLSASAMLFLQLARIHPFVIEHRPRYAVARWYGVERALTGAMASTSRLFVSFWMVVCSALALEPSQSSRSCTVTEVYDGDTLTAFCGGRSIRVRISSIDAPEI